jgi:SAM-dependent methyltransferase
VNARAATRLLRATAARWPARWVITRVNLVRNREKIHRKLEIGAGGGRHAGFETLDITARRNVDYIADASKRLPFKDDTFEVVYASHVLEHLPWYRLEQALQEWVRVLKPGGALEIWVPNGLEICRVFVDYETTGEDRTQLDGWYRFNPDRDPCRWAAGRIFTYGDGKGSPAGPNWHRAIFSPRYLKKLLESAGLEDVRRMDRAEVRGDDHGWINLGLQGRKP